MWYPSPRTAALVASVGAAVTPWSRAGAVDDEGPQSEGRDALVLPVDPCVSLVRLLVDAVVRDGPREGVLALERAGGVVGAEVGGRARIDKRACDPLAALLDRLEDVHGAEDVHRRAERGVLAAERNLQGGEMDHARDLVVVQNPAEVLGQRDVALDERDALELVRRHDLAQPTWVGADVEPDHLGALAHERASHPGPEAAQYAGDEKALGHGQP